MNIAGYIDHTLLKPEATAGQVMRMCEEAEEFRFASVCVNSCHAETVTGKLAGSGIATCVVVGFPLGAALTEVKVFEALKAVDLGASEIDMVMNIGALKAGRTDLLKKDIRSVVYAVERRAIIKVIIECCLLTDREKRMACEAAVEAGAAYVKTSTGFGAGGATVEDVKLMKDAVCGRAKIKASGGIRNLAKALAMIDAGADRIGTSSGVSIVMEDREKPDLCNL